MQRCLGPRRCPIRCARDSGHYVTLNFVVLVTDPSAVATVILPVFAPVGTLTFRVVVVSLMIVALVPLKVTLGATLEVRTFDGDLRTWPT